MSKRSHVLIIDDDPIMRDMLDAVLTDDHDVSIAPGGAEGLRILKDQNIDLILLDVDMPKPNGYELCKTIKADAHLAQIPVIFLSGRSNIEERLKGYEAGGDDYLIKPYQPDELKAKIGVLLQQAARHRELFGQVNDVLDAAMASASLYGEVGILLDFMKEANASTSYQKVADALFRALNRFEFEGCLRLFGHGGVINTTGPTPCSALEESLLNHVQRAGNKLAVQTLGTNTVYFYGHVMLLGRNLLPASHASHASKEDAERHGRARDNIALLAEAASTRIRAIDAEVRVVGAAQHKQLVELTRDALLDLNAEQRIHREKISSVLREMVVETERMLITMALTEEQEAILLDMLNRYINETLSIFDEGDRIEVRLEQVISKLNESQGQPQPA